MGITGELVRNVFSKSRSTKTHEINKKRWKTSVKSYLCGDDIFDSVLAEEDSASVKSSEVTVTHTLTEFDAHSTTEDMQSQEVTNHENSDRDHSSSCSRFLDEDAAATMIQSAFRGYQARCSMREITGSRNDFGEGIQSPSRESLATSVAVQTGNSIEAVSIQGEDPSVSNKPQQKPKPSTFKPKEDWDDSTLDSTRAKMRIQNRLEAMTRRERALAYAFSQQLRICSKKQQQKTDDKEPNMGWSWLERWMATRQTEVSPVDDNTSKQLINDEAVAMSKARPSLKNKILDLSFEEKESCGSNEVPVTNEISSPIPQKDGKDTCKLAKNRLKASKSISRRKTAPTYHRQKEHSKVTTNKDGSKEPENDRRQKAKHSRSRSSVCKDDASSWLPTNQCVSG